MQRIQSGRKRDNSTPDGLRQSHSGCKGYRAGGKLIKRRAENLMSKSRSHETSDGKKLRKNWIKGGAGTTGTYVFD